jgi:hypothetical protein
MGASARRPKLFEDDGQHAVESVIAPRSARALA